jgi:hypothetical protein
MLYALYCVGFFSKCCSLNSIRELNAINLSQKYFKNSIFYRTNPTFVPHILLAKRGERAIDYAFFSHYYHFSVK